MITKTTSPKKILIVDDEPALLFVMEQMLITSGHRVIATHDPESAIGIYSKFWKEIDVVVSDLTMPDMDGEQFFSELKKVNPQVKFIIITGFVNIEREVLLKRLGISGFVDKPFRAEKILRLIDDITC
jgi:DNA-binding NtrC family response regulator